MSSTTQQITKVDDETQTSVTKPEPKSAKDGSPTDIISDEETSLDDASKEGKKM